MRDLHVAMSDTVSSGTFGVTNGTVLTQNVNRSLFFVQNLHTGILYLKLGTGASNTSFNVSLKSCTVQDDGNGGAYSDNTWVGPVSVSGVFTRYTAWELS